MTPCSVHARRNKSHVNRKLSKRSSPNPRDQTVGYISPSHHWAGMTRQIRDGRLPHGKAKSATPLLSLSLMSSTSYGLLFSFLSCIIAKKNQSPSYLKAVKPENGQRPRQLGTCYPRPHHCFPRSRPHLPLPPHHYPRVDCASILVR